MAEPRCPQCGKPVLAAQAPFCSARCRQVDLGRWLRGDYAIPGSPAEDGAGAANGPSQPENSED